MAKSETIRAHVDSKLKAQAEGVLEKLGLNASEAIRLYSEQVALRKGLPFDVALPNARTRKALKEADAGENLIRYESFDDFANSGPFPSTNETRRNPNLAWRTVLASSTACDARLDGGKDSR